MQVMRALFFCAAILSAGVSPNAWGQNPISPDIQLAPKSDPSSYLPSQSPSSRQEKPLTKFEDVIGKGIWKYTWPHGHIPQKITGYQLVASPVEGIDEDKGCTMRNWGRPVVFRSLKTSAKASVRCYVDLAGVKLDQPWMDEGWPPSELERVEFHGLKAGMIVLKPKDIPELPLERQPHAGSGATPPQPSHSQPKPKETWTVDFVFRMGDIVFGVHAIDEISSQNASTAAREAGEGIYLYQLQSNKGKRDNRGKAVSGYENFNFFKQVKIQAIERMDFLNAPCQAWWQLTEDRKSRHVSRDAVELMCQPMRGHPTS